MAQPFPYLDESVRLVRTPLSQSGIHYGSAGPASPVASFLAPSQAGSAQSSFLLPSFKMSSKYDLGHQPRQYFFYISVLCMLYCVIYRLFLYWELYQHADEFTVSHSFLPTITTSSSAARWIFSFNGFISLVCLAILIFITILVTLVRIHNQCSPENVQILLFSVLRLCVMFVLNFIVIIFADSFILFTFISYVFNPSSSSDSHHVDVFWQSIRKYLKDAEDDDHHFQQMQQNQEQEQEYLTSPPVERDDDEEYLDDDDNRSLNQVPQDTHKSQPPLYGEKMRRLITIHYYCMKVYIDETKHYSNRHNYNAGIFGRKQQQRAIQRLRPIVFNEYNQREHATSASNLCRFGFSTPQSLSSYHRRTDYQQQHRLKHHDLQIWFSVILWMPVFLNDQRYHFYWIIEKLLLRISLIVILVFVIYTETKYAIQLLPIPTIIRCVLEIVNLLNLIPFIIYDDPDFDNIAELYSSRELAASIGKKRKIDIIKDINKTYAQYTRNLTYKQQPPELNIPAVPTRGNMSNALQIMRSAERKPMVYLEPMRSITPLPDISPAKDMHGQPRPDNVKGFHGAAEEAKVYHSDQEGSSSEEDDDDDEEEEVEDENSSSSSQPDGEDVHLAPVPPPSDTDHREQTKA